MDELIVYRQTVELAPLEDVAKFMLIAPEKAKAQAAEIRAMENLGVAEEVLKQKKEEQRMLSELILDAGARIGELTKEIPKASGNQYTNGDVLCNSGDTKQKTKEQIGEELGFNRVEMSRFERLADNRDLIEEEKAKAREEDRQPTRTNVLEAVQKRTEDKVLEYAAEHPDESFREIAKSTGTNHQFVSRTIEKRKFPYAKETKERYSKIREIAEQMGNATNETTFDDVLRLLDSIENDFIARIERTIESEREKLSADDRWPDAIEGYFDSVIADINELKERIIK